MFSSTSFPCPLSIQFVSSFQISICSSWSSSISRNHIPQSKPLSLHFNFIPNLTLLIINILLQLKRPKRIHNAPASISHYSRNYHPISIPQLFLIFPAVILFFPWHKNILDYSFFILPQRLEIHEYFVFFSIHWKIPRESFIFSSNSFFYINPLIFIQSLTNRVYFLQDHLPIHTGTKWL